MIHTVKGFSIINEAEVDVFLELSCFLYDPVDASNLISGSSAFSKSSLNMWKFSVHVLLKPGLEYFEYYFACVWDECNCVVVWIFFGIAFLWDWNENWPFPVTIREIEIKTISYHLLRWLLKGLKYVFRMDVGKRELFTVVGTVNWAATIENSIEIPQKIKNKTTTWLGFSISTLYAKNRKTIIQKVICTPVIVTASFKIAKKWKQPKCP